MRASAVARSEPHGAIDGGNHVATVDPGDGGRRIAERPYHAQRPIRGGDLDADAGISAGGADAQVGVFLGVEIGRVRVEAADHAAQRIVDEPRTVHLVDVFALHAVEDLGNLRRIGGGKRCLRGGRSHGLSGGGRGDVAVREHGAAQRDQHTQGYSERQHLHGR